MKPAIIAPAMAILICIASLREMATTGRTGRSERRFRAVLSGVAAEPAPAPCTLGGFQIASMPPEWAAARLIAGRGGNADGYAGGAWRRQAAAGISRTRARIAADAHRRRRRDRAPPRGDAGDRRRADRARHLPDAAAEVARRRRARSLDLHRGPR